MQTYNKTTELGAVNTILRYLGKAPVSSLSSLKNTLAQRAKEALHEISREVQSKGLSCNTDVGIDLYPDSNGIITVPSNALEVDTTYEYPKVVERDSKLYNTTDNTYVFKDSLKVDVVYFLAFEKLPEPVRRYIVIRSARQIATQVLSNEKKFSLTQYDEQVALVAIKQYEQKINKVNVFNGNSNLLKRGRNMNLKGRGWY